MRGVQLHRAALGAGAICAALLTSGCGWQTYAITRAARHVTGAKTRDHTLQPLASSLRGYRVIELHEFSNMLPGRVPAPMERYLGDRIARALSRITAAPVVERVSALDLAVARLSPDTRAEAVLLADGFLDDYEPGSRALRIVELGFNHVAVTVRMQLRDKQSNRLLGAVSVTAEDDRETGTTKAAIDRVASRIGRFVESGFAR
ncbi:MAG: hypothetical protein ABJC89_05280 [Acidobacteriota bacterium]